MKTLYITRFLSILIVAFSISSCVQDGEFTVPQVPTGEENDHIVANSSIAAIKTALQQEYNSNGNLIYTFPADATTVLYAEGYVVSSDAAGNFYKKLIIQDKEVNPTSGIEIDLDMTSLSQQFEIGRKVYVKLNGLSVSYDDGASTSSINPTNGVVGKYILGVLDGTRVEDIPSTSVTNHIFLSSTVKEIVPTAIAISEISEVHINTMVSLESAQFEKNQLGKTFAGEANDSFDGFRDIFECGTEKILKLQTSTFSDFKSSTVPRGKGRANFVLSKDYFAEFFVAIINTPSDLDFSDADRCDPLVLDCGTGSVGGNKVLLDEDFTSLTSDSELAAAGWTNVNASGGDTKYQSRSFSGNRYMQITAFNSDENPMEAWLVTPAIDLDTTTDEELTFNTKTGYNNGSALSVYVSSNFTGDVATATWVKVDATLANGPSSGYEANFTSSGSINLSCLSGNVHVAFRYVGGDGGVTTTFQVDDVKVTGN